MEGALEPSFSRVMNDCVLLSVTTTYEMCLDSMHSRNARWCGKGWLARMPSHPGQMVQRGESLRIPRKKDAMLLSFLFLMVVLSGWWWDT